MAIVVLCGLVVIVAAVSHSVIDRYLLASIVAAVCSSLLIQCIAYIEVGYLDPFFLIGLVCGGAYAFGISLIVGIPFWSRRRHRISPGHCQKCGYDLTGNVSGVCPECGESA